MLHFPLPHLQRKKGIQPGIGKGDRKRRLQGFEVLLARLDGSKDASESAKHNQAAGDDDGGVGVGGAIETTTGNNPSVVAAISSHRGREAARDKRPRGGLAPSLVNLCWEHQLPAALAAGVAAAARASEQEASASSTSRGEGMDAGAEGPASAAAALVFAAVRQVRGRGGW